MALIAVDTNIVVRFLTGDDEAQYQASRDIFARRDVFIPNSVILETEWVLRFAYDFAPKEIAEAFTKLFGLDNVALEDEPSSLQALDWYLQGLDFADALHLASSQHCASMRTFDRAFVKRAKKLSRCAVEHP